MQPDLKLKRPISSYAKVRSLVGAVFRNRAFHFNRAAIERREYLDIGCGPNTHSGFINLDYNWHPGIDICWDVTRALPLRSQTVKGIFTEHALEHLPIEAVDRVLGECLRVLRPGGALRIAVPDGELYLMRYAENFGKVSGSPMPYAQTDAYRGLYSPIMSVNRIFRAHGHRFIFDFDTLRQLLERNGFVEIEKASFRSGRDRNLLLDTPSRAVESLYVEAAAPPPKARGDGSNSPGEPIQARG